MKELTNPFEIEQYRQSLQDQRLNEQNLNSDFDDDMEVCEDCGCNLNSHGHCPRCDY